jgi:hypothetical protein
MISGFSALRTFPADTQIQDPGRDSGRLLRVIRKVTKLSVPNITRRDWLFFRWRLLRRLRALRGIGTRIASEVLHRPDDEPIDEEKRQAIDDHPEQTEQHGYFLLTGL